jgi:hypothetical protein
MLKLAMKPGPNILAAQSPPQLCEVYLIELRKALSSESLPEFGEVFLAEQVL